MEITLKEQLYDLKSKRKDLFDEVKALVEGDKLDSDEYKAKNADLEKVIAKIATIEALIEKEAGFGPEEDPVEKGMRGAADGGPDGKPVNSVKAFADAARAGFKVSKAAGDMSQEGVDADGGYTVPEDIVYRVEKYRESKASLRGLVSVENVTTLSGRRTFKKRSQQTGFTKVGEGGKISKKAGPQFETKSYTISKYAGFFAVTNELLDDSDENITSCLVEWIGDEARVTDNTLILAAINKNTATDLTDLAGIKKALYVDLDAAFRSTSKIVTNADGVYWLSQLQDKNGRDLLTPIPSEPGKMQLAVGAKVFPVEEFPNADLPSTGTKAPFILGDLKAGIRLFDRKQLTLTASDVAVAGDFNAYEQDMTLTKAVERLDVQQWDGAAFINGYIDLAAQTADITPGDDD